MRKQMKLKRRSCALCKPHKRGWTNRWHPLEAALIHEYEDDRSKALAHDVSPELEPEAPAIRRRFYCM